jgi:hypothetical protein
MEIKERVYTLKSVLEIPFLYLEREGETMLCPFTGTEQSDCGEWCPAFQVIPKHTSGRGSMEGTMPTMVYLNCFPERTSYKIKD